MVRRTIGRLAYVIAFPGPPTHRVGLRTLAVVACFGLLVAAAGFGCAKHRRAIDSRSDVPAPQRGVSPTTAADADPIQSLIRQLGSANDAEVRSAGKKLLSIGTPALESLQKAANDKDANIAESAQQLAERIENGLDNLLAVYRSYGLPMPPDHARLVISVGTEVIPMLYAPGVRKPPLAEFGQRVRRLVFLVREGNEQKPPEVFDGLRVHGWASPRVQVTFTNLTKISPEELRTLVIENKPWNPFFFALQCKARGWDRLARAILELHCSHGELPYRRRLASEAWTYWHDELGEQNADRASIARRLHQLIRQEKPFDNDRNRSLVRRLDETVVPRPVKPGSIEAAVDNLKEGTADPGIYNNDEPLDDPVYARVAEFGLAAVPELIKHLDDHRLTRASRSVSENGMHPDPNWTPEIEISDIAEWLLKELSGDQILWRAHPKQPQAAAEAWLRRALVLGEEAYLLERAPFALDTSDLHDSLIIRLIGRKYPTHLPARYKTALRSPADDHTGSLARAVSRSTLSREEKLEMLLYAAARTRGDSWIAAVRPIRNLDPKRFAEILTEKIAGFSTKLSDAEIDERFRVVPLVCETDDPRPWRVLAEKARRSDAEGRLEWLDLVGPALIGNPIIQRQRRANFFAQFLDDLTARKLDEDNPPDEVIYPDLHCLEVRDFAALQIAQILELPVKFPWDRSIIDDDWTPAQWADLRGKVRDALKREHIADTSQNR